MTTAQALKIVRNENRRAVMEALSKSRVPISPAEIARQTKLPVNLVAYHMGLLAKAGAAELVGTKPRRGSTEHFYLARVKVRVSPGRAKPRLVIKSGKDAGAFFTTPASIKVTPIKRRARAVV